MFVDIKIARPERSGLIVLWTMLRLGRHDPVSGDTNGYRDIFVRGPVR